jgi:parvulin-like peptidyl-prolyl isomerase
MPQNPLISPNEILQQLKVSCQFPTVVQSVMARKIVTQTAQSKGIQIEPAELQKAADSFRLKNNLSGAKETLAWLQTYLLSIDDLEALVHHTVLSAKLANHLFQDKVEPYFAEHQLNYTQVFLYEVIFSNLDLAMELFYAIQEQEITFTEVARKYSQDPEHRRRGGYCGLLTRKDLKPEISAAVFAATPPQVLRPIVVGKRVHLVWAEEVLSPTLDDDLRQQILSELFADWLQQQTANLDFEQILDPVLLPASKLHL